MKKVVIIENIRSIHNVGAIFRTADGAGYDQIFCCGFSPDPSDPRIAKVALGAETHIPWKHAEDVLSVIKELKSGGFQIYVLENTPAAEPLFECEIDNADFALVFGHEVSGVSAEVLAAADRVFVIPMRGKKESLNVSVAAGIAMYELVRKVEISLIKMA